MTRAVPILLLFFAVAWAAPCLAPDTPDRQVCNPGPCETADGQVGAPGSCDTDADSPKEEPQPKSGIPVARQWLPDSHGGWTRSSLNARLLLRLPGLSPVPGLHNHGLMPWIEWQMDQARLASASMAILAPDISPHAPPRAPRPLVPAA